MRQESQAPVIGSYSEVRHTSFYLSPLSMKPRILPRLDMVRGTKRKGVPDAHAGTPAKKSNKQLVAVEASANLSTKINPDLPGSPESYAENPEPPEKLRGSDDARRRAETQDETSDEEDEDAVPSPPRKENSESDKDELGKHARAAHRLG